MFTEFKKIVRKSLANSSASFPVEVSVEERKILETSKAFSMTSYERLWATMCATKYIVRNDIPGALVECGVWRGGNAIAVAMTLNALGSTNRPIFLFDTFEGMSKPSYKDIDHSGVPAQVSLENSTKNDRDHNWCVASLEDVQQNLKIANYPLENLHLIKGDVALTLKKESNLPGSISLLRLDTDWYDSTKIEMEILFPKI